MVNAGELAEIVNADQTELRNVTDSLEYGQLYNIRWNSMVPQFPKKWSDGGRETLDGVRDVIIEGDILITEPEVLSLVTLNTPTGTPPQLPIKTWRFFMTARNLTTRQADISGKLVGLSFLAKDKGEAWFHVTVENTTETVTAA